MSKRCTWKTINTLQLKTLIIFYQKLSDLPTIDELGSAGLIDTSSIDQSIFDTGKFLRTDCSKKQNDVYDEIDEAIKKALMRKMTMLFRLNYCIY